MRWMGTAWIQGMRNLLQAALEASVRRIVTESFLAVFGPAEPHRRLREDDPLMEVAQEDPLREAVLALTGRTACRGPIGAWLRVRRPPLRICQRPAGPFHRGAGAWVRTRLLFLPGGPSGVALKPAPGCHKGCFRLVLSCRMRHDTHGEYSRSGER